MIFQLTTRNCRISDISRKYISYNLAKVIKLLNNFESDLIVLRLTIRKNTDKYYPARIHTHKRKNYSQIKPALSNFEGSVNFWLLKNNFYNDFKGKTIDECINLGFEAMLKKIKKFKNLHFSAASEYPNRSSIRGGVLNG